MIKQRVVSWLVLAAGGGVSALALRGVAGQWAGTGSFLGSYSPKLAVLMALVAGVGLLALVGLGLSFTRRWPRLLAGLDRLAGRAAGLGVFLPALGILLWLALPALMWIQPWNYLLLGGLYSRLWAIWALSLVQLSCGAPGARPGTR